MPAAEHEPRRPVVGILLLDKPEGVTSNRILQRAKRLYRATKAGHTGTLDPMATGMLPVCFGAATKVSGLMLEASKRYRVTARFGVATDTGDATGTEIERLEGKVIPEAAIVAAASGMIGRRDQVPPMYSAVRHEGRRLYKLAREGREVPRQARTVEIHNLGIESCHWPHLTFTVHCSKGTYVRTLVTDLAAELGTVGHVAALRRLSVGPFDESQMVSLDTLEASADQGAEALDRWLLEPDKALLDRPALTLSGPQSLALRQGQTVTLDEGAKPGSVRVYAPDGRFVGLGQIDATSCLRASRIFPG